jgi:hypothetical protein
VSAAAEDAKGHKKLAGYMLRAPMSLHKMALCAAHNLLRTRSRRPGLATRNRGRIEFPIVHYINKSTHCFITSSHQLVPSRHFSRLVADPRREKHFRAHLHTQAAVAKGCRQKFALGVVASKRQPDALDFNRLVMRNDLLSSDRDYFHGPREVYPDQLFDPDHNAPPGTCRACGRCRTFRQR